MIYIRYDIYTYDIAHLEQWLFFYAIFMLRMLSQAAAHVDELAHIDEPGFLVDLSKFTNMYDDFNLII